MATINPTVTRLNDDAVSVQWPSITENDVCTPYEGFSEYSDRSVQVQGTFGVATITVKGTNDGANYQTLNDPFGSALSITTASLKQILEYVWKMKPETSGGTGSSVTVTIVAKRIRR